MQNELENEERDSRDREERQSEAQEYDSFLYKFQQQIIDAWRPVPHTGSNVILYIILSAICVGLGLGLVLSAPNSQEVYINYTDCSPVIGTLCSRTFTLTQKLEAPIYFYYGFKGFYQNHRRYLKYYSSEQLEKGRYNPTGSQPDCGDYVTNQQTFGSTTSRIASNPPLTPGETAFPCGTIARFYYKLYPEITGFTIEDSSTNNIPFTQKGIAWPSDIGRHKNPSDITKAAFSVEEETWLVWFRPAARSQFYKLNGIIQQDLPAGTYTVKNSNVNVDPTFGQKWISFSKSNFVGNRDLFLGIAFLALGGGCLILLIVFLSKWIAEKRDRQKFQ